jgi:hypothetical protein
VIHLREAYHFYLPTAVAVVLLREKASCYYQQELD